MTPITQRDPLGAASGFYRVIRGGSWSDAVRFCRVSSRSSNVPVHCLSLIHILTETGGERVVTLGCVLLSQIHWSSSVTPKQKEILSRLVENMVQVEGRCV